MIYWRTEFYIAIAFSHVGFVASSLSYTFVDVNEQRIVLFPLGFYFSVIMKFHFCDSLLVFLKKEASNKKVRIYLTFD